LTLDLGGSNASQDPTFWQLLASNPALASLHLCHCTWLGDEQLLGLRACSALQELSISGAPRLRGWALGQLAGLPRLTTLELAACRALDGTFLAQLAGCGALRRLALRGCPSVQGGALGALVARAPSLVEMELGVMSGVGAGEREALLAALSVRG
jgi:hypothetical protein